MRSSLICGTLALVSAATVSAQSAPIQAPVSGGNDYFALYIGGTALTGIALFASALHHSHAGPSQQLLTVAPPNTPESPSGFLPTGPNSPPPTINPPVNNPPDDPPQDSTPFNPSSPNNPVIDQQLGDDVPTTVPEPATLMLVATGLAGLGTLRRRSRR